MIGLGTDIVAVARIAAVIDRHGDRFLDRCFTAGERAAAAGRGPRAAETLAARWAAKEAFVKAIGARGRSVAMRDVEVVSDSAGAPSLKLAASAAEALAAVGGGRVLVSLSHESDHAVAVVMIE